VARRVFVRPPPLVRDFAIALVVVLLLAWVAEWAAARTWVDVRTQPLEFTSGALTVATPLTQEISVVERAGAHELARIELAGHWFDRPAPEAVLAQIFEVGTTAPLSKATGRAGASVGTIDFEFGRLELLPKRAYELRLSPGEHIERVPFAPLVRVRARLGARAAAETDTEPRLRHEFDIVCASDEWSGFVLPMPAGAANSARFAVRGADEQAPLRSGTFAVAAGLGRHAFAAFDPLPDSRGRRYSIELGFDQPAALWSGRRGIAHAQLHGTRGPSPNLRALRRAGTEFGPLDLVLRAEGGSPTRPRGVREWVGLVLLALLFACALAATRRIG